MTWPTTLLVMTDGRRDCIQPTIASADANLKGDIARRLIHDDSGDETYAAWLASTFPDWEIVRTMRRSGFGGAIRSAWHYLCHFDRNPFIFTLEDDFTFERPVDLGAMARVLDSKRYLAQMALRRQAWNPVEHAAGGVIEANPNAYLDVTDGVEEWLEHVLFWTTNPHLFRRELIYTGWPEGDQSEGRFGLRLLQDGFASTRPEQVRFGYWGARRSGVAVTHIGHVRAGVGY